jgi:hypothetical protein
MSQQRVMTVGALCTEFPLRLGEGKLSCNSQDDLAKLQKKKKKPLSLF